MGRGEEGEGKNSLCCERLVALLDCKWEVNRCC